MITSSVGGASLKESVVSFTSIQARPSSRFTPKSAETSWCQLSSARGCFAIWHVLGKHSAFLRGERGQRLWIQQECLRPSCSDAVTPCGKDSVPRNKTTGKVGQIVKGCPFTGDNHVGEQRVIGMHMGASFDRGDHRHTNVGKIL